MKLWWLDALDSLDALDALEGDARRATAASAACADPAMTVTASTSTFVEARALIAMACVDGAPNERERACVARFVDAGVAWRVYRPRDAGVPDGALAARRVLERMAHVALSDRDDGVVDDSERALLLTYARAYGVLDDEVARLVADHGARARGAGWSRWREALSSLVARRRRSSSSSSRSRSSSLSSVSFAVRPREVR